MKNHSWAKYNFVKKNARVRCYYCFRTKIGYKFQWDDQTNNIVQKEPKTKLKPQVREKVGDEKEGKAAEVESKAITDESDKAKGSKEMAAQNNGAGRQKN